MIDKIIHYSITHKINIGMMVIAIIAGGIWAMNSINVDSTPDITNNQVQVITVSPNLSTTDIEQYVTYPVEMAMSNLPGVEDLRSISRFGLSVVTVIFKEKMGTYLPRQLVQEKLNEVKDNIPEGFGTPEMGPISTGLGEILQYTLIADTGMYTAQELRTLQDWTVKRQLNMIPGVVEVNSFGGSVKQYEIAFSPAKLNALHVSINELFEALHKNNINTGGAYIEKDHKANFIRGDGIIKSLDDIKNIVVKNTSGVPITIGDAADEVHYGSPMRYGAFTQDGHEAVGGTILMLKGANSAEVIDGVRPLGDFYLNQLTKENDIDWVFFSPAGEFDAQGERTGKYRLGKDDLIVDKTTGTSHISVKDYAAAMVDELEKPAHHKERFTIGY